MDRQKKKNNDSVLGVFYWGTKSDGSTEEDKVGQNPDDFPIYIGTPEDCVVKKSFMGNMYMDGVY